MESAVRYLEGIKVNRDKSRAVSVYAIRNFKFLGFALGRNKDGIYIRVYPKSWKKFKARLKDLPSRRRVQSLKPSLKNIGRINGWLYRRIRMCIWKRWKRPRTKMRNLMKLGVSRDLAFIASNTRRGHWFVSRTAAGHRLLLD